MAIETRRAVASLWLGQPPDFPVLVKTSQMPFSSEFTVIYRLPQPIRTFSVYPAVTAGRRRGFRVP